MTKKVVPYCCSQQPREGKQWRKWRGRSMEWKDNKKDLSVHLQHGLRELPSECRDSNLNPLKEQPVSKLLSLLTIPDHINVSIKLIMSWRLLIINGHYNSYGHLSSVGFREFFLFCSPKGSRLSVPLKPQSQEMTAQRWYERQGSSTSALPAHARVPMSSFI